MVEYTSLRPSVFHTKPSHSQLNPDGSIRNLGGLSSITTTANAGGMESTSA
jgi:hypothetical protein